MSCCDVKTVSGIVPAGTPGVCLFGYQNVQDDTLFSTNTAKAFAPTKTLTTPVGFVAGTYRFSFTYIVSGFVNLRSFLCNVDLDGVDLFLQTQVEQPHGNDNVLPFARMSCLALTAGVHLFRVWIGANTIFETYTIRETVLELWRVS